MVQQWLPILSAVVLWSILVYLLWDVLRWLGRIKRTVAKNLSIPCHRCRYANLDYDYLKCAVRPQEAFSEQAIQCPDFIPVEKTLPLKER